MWQTQGLQLVRSHPGNQKLETGNCLCDFCGYIASNTVLRYTQPTLADEPFPDLELRRAALPEEKWQATEFLEVTDANFDQDVLKSEQPVLVDFWAAWCGPCRALAPIVDELAKDYHGKIKVGKMDVDSNSATPMRYGVRGIPTLLVFKGGQVKEQIVGYVPKETIQKAIDKHVG